MTNGTPTATAPQLTIWCNPLEGSRHVELSIGLGPIGAKIVLPLEAIDAVIQALNDARAHCLGSRIIQPPPGARVA